jgi:hypothetical protein
MGFRPDLDLSGILSSFDRWVTPDQEDVDDAPESDGIKFAEPTRLGWGPLEWSASTELATRIVFRWDVNGYYAALGVKPEVTRKELREAYQAKDGQSSVRLTHILKMLLNPEIRKRYDETPLGEPFFDEMSEADLKRRAHREAGRRSAAGKVVSGEDVLGEWGFTLLDPGVDTVTSNRQDSSRQAAQWSYSYYGWKTNSFLTDVDVLQQWQAAISRTAADRLVTQLVSIGVTGSSDRPFILKEVDGRMVIFFSEGEEPTDTIARQAIDEFIDSSQFTEIH